MIGRVTLLALALVSCGYDIDVGTLEGGVPVKSDGCAPALVGADCTAGQSGCTFDSECPSALKCNQATRRCYSTTATCEGTPCNFDKDCAANERCNDSLKICANMTRLQTCRPCTFDDDCGGTKCATFAHTCE